MERRAFLTGKTPARATSESILLAAPPPPPPSFEKFTGPWTKATASHLLRRATYGYNFGQLNQAVSLGMQTVVARLFSPTPITELPLNYNYADDPESPIGTTWVNNKYGIDANTTNYQYRSLRAWRVLRQMSGEQTIREKMATFWINHFGIADIQDGRYLWKYMTTIYDHYAGNFKSLIEKITIDPSMLIFLNGNTNQKAAPNENFAREVLELFTIGKGPIAGPGDYTNYTEADVLALAKVFTGWRNSNYRNPNREGFGSYFTANLHDTTTKTLSARFNNAKIANNNDKEYIDAINIIFQQEEVSKFIARKLYVYFVYYEISPEVETNIITPMATIIRQNNYDLKAALQALFSSQHFYDATVVGGMIKNPQDMVAQPYVAVGKPAFTDYKVSYPYAYNVDLVHGVLQMMTFDPPSVAGWKAYYQEPSYYQGWINSVTLPQRVGFTNAIHTRNANYRGLNLVLDSVAFINGLSNPSNINALISDAADVLIVKPFTSAQVAAIKQILNGTKTDADWKLEYDTMKNNPTNTTLKTNLGTKVSNMLKYVSIMPEYQLS